MANILDEGEEIFGGRGGNRFHPYHPRPNAGGRREMQQNAPPREITI